MRNSVHWQVYAFIWKTKLQGKCMENLIFFRNTWFSKCHYKSDFCIGCNIKLALLSICLIHAFLDRVLNETKLPIIILLVRTQVSWIALAARGNQGLQFPLTSSSIYIVFQQLTLPGPKAIVLKTEGGGFKVTEPLVSASNI